MVSVVVGAVGTGIDGIVGSKTESVVVSLSPESVDVGSVYSVDVELVNHDGQSITWSRVEEVDESPSHCG